MGESFNQTVGSLSSEKGSGTILLDMKHTSVGRGLGSTHGSTPSFTSASMTPRDETGTGVALVTEDGASPQAEDDPNQDKALVVIGEGEEDGAEEEGEEQQEEEEETLTVRSADENYTKGIEAIRRHHYENALRLFSRAIFLAPGEPLPYVARAEAYTHLCDFRSAIANYRKALTIMRDPVAAEDLRGRLAQVLDTYGVVLFKSGEIDNALRYFEESLIERPSHPVVTLHQCLCWVALKKYDAAAPLLRGLVKDPSVEADASIVLVQILMKDRDFAAAKRLLEETLFRFPEHPRVLDTERLFDETFNAYKLKAERDLDVDALTRCIAAFGEDADLFRLRGLAYSHHKSYTLAVQDLFSCINKSGGSNPVAAELMASILCTIADELVESQDFVAASTYYGEAIKWGEDLVEAFIARGDCLQRLGKHESALHDYKHVLETHPENLMAKERLGQLHDTWGSILYNQGNYKMAETEFSRAIQYLDTLPAFHYHRALARIMLKEPTLAVRDLVSCRDLGATDPDIVRLVHQFCAPGHGIIAQPSATSEEMSSTQSLATSGAHVGSSARSSLVTAPNQIALGEGKAGSHHRHSTVSATQQILEELPSGAELRLSNKELLQLKRDGETGKELWSLRLDRQDTLLSGKYTPTAIRDYVKETRIAEHTAVKVEHAPNLGAKKKIIEMESKEKARVVPQHIGGPLWKGTQVKIPSRLDLVQVSEEAPVPLQYAERQRHRIERERLRQQEEEAKIKAALQQNATVPGPSGSASTGPVPPAHGHVRGSGKRTHLRGFTLAPPASGATFSVVQVDPKTRPDPHHQSSNTTSMKSRTNGGGAAVVGTGSTAPTTTTSATDANPLSNTARDRLKSSLRTAPSVPS
jgi:tetratricopeptide (TPR) repeat protein